MRNITKMIRDSKGATAIEYGLLASLIAIAASAGFSSVGTGLKTKFNSIGNSISNAS